MSVADDTLATVDGVGDVIARSISSWFAQQANLDFVAKLRDAGVDFGRVETSNAPQTLEGKAVVVTGTLDGFDRESAERAIKERGGKSPGSVSAKTFAVVIGREPGASKVTKAESLGVPMLDEEGFRHLLDTGKFARLTRAKRATRPSENFEGPGVTARGGATLLDLPEDHRHVVATDRVRLDDGGRRTA